MTDVFSPAKRSAVMRKVHSVDTNLEITVRRMVHRLGFRYGLHRKDLPGKPDLVFSSRNKIIFIHGCYWHQHHCEAGKRPASNKQYWNLKLDRNVKRDKRNVRVLRKQGWSVLTVWECETRDPERLRQRLLRFLKLGAA